MTALQELSIVRASEEARTHEEWLRFICDGMTMLLCEPRLLIELIWHEAARQANRHASGAAAAHRTSGEAFKIFDELGLLCCMKL